MNVIDKVEFKGGREVHQENINTVNLVGNILTSVAIFILTIYNVYFTQKLLFHGRKRF